MERKITYFENNPTQKGMAAILPDIVFSKAQGVELKLALMVPWGNPEAGEKKPRYPLVVFLQGSGWTFPGIGYEIPQLGMLARTGYVVATITHRSRMEGHPYPAFLEDTKTAIRFLRAHAEEYSIDPNRVCMWGTSSGGNTSLLVGLTGDDPAFKTEEYADQSDAVQLVLDCFGPTDMLHFGPNAQDSEERGMHQSELARTLAGTEDLETIRKVMKAMSPIYRVEKGKCCPPILMMHGDADSVVPYDQSLRMLDVLLEAGADAQLACIKEAPHEGTFWSQELWDFAMAFIREKL